MSCAGIICTKENGGKNKICKRTGPCVFGTWCGLDSKSQQGFQSHSVRAPVPIIESGAFGMQQQQVNTMQSGDNAQLAAAAATAQKHFSTN